MAEYELTNPGIGGVEEPEVPFDNFHSGVMNPRDVLANILRNVKSPEIAGVTYKFEGPHLVLGVSVYEYPCDTVLKDLVGTINEVIKWLRNKYKAETGKALKLKKLGDNYDVTGAYTVDKKSKITYFLTFDISGNIDDSTTNSLDNHGSGLKTSEKFNPKFS